MNHKNIIEIKNIKSFIGQTKVFDSLSLNIEAGCNTVVLGPNGSGKSTLLKLISNELFPVHNENSFVKVFGRNKWNIWELRSHIGIVSNYIHEFIFDCSTGINVILSGLFASPDIGLFHELTQEQIKEAESILKFLDLEELHDREFCRMSTGQQRKLLLGRALINNPEVLILDEPTSGLDIKACSQYVNIISSLMQQGKTIILVTHHIHEIPPEISNVILLKQGAVFVEGKKEDILKDDIVSSLFDISVRLVKSNGFYQVIFN